MNYYEEGKRLFDGLFVLELANNLRWSWNQPTKELFRAIDPETWLTRRGVTP